MRFPKKPANPFPATAGAITSIRASLETAEALETLKSVLIEWLLMHPETMIRKTALSLTSDRALRIILATFARDYGIVLDPNPQEER